MSIPMNLQLLAHTTCTVCNKGLDIDGGEASKCNVCKNYVHDSCFDDEAGMCDACSKKMDEE